MFISANTPQYSTNTLNFDQVFEVNSVVEVVTPSSMPASATVLSFTCSGTVEGEPGVFTYPVMFFRTHYLMQPSTSYLFAFDGYYFNQIQGPEENNTLTY